jgi:hypothetical protein
MSADVILGPFFFCAAVCSFDLWKNVMIILYTLHAFWDIWLHHYNRSGTFIFPEFSSRINPRPFVHISKSVEVKRNSGGTHCQLPLVLSTCVELNIFSYPVLGASVAYTNSL